MTLSVVAVGSEMITAANLTPRASFVIYHLLLYLTRPHGIIVKYAFLYCTLGKNLLTNYLCFFLNFFFSNMQFSTNDNDNDLKGTSCAQEYHGSWWYSNCHSSNLNGLYLSGPHSSDADGVNWYTFRGNHYSLKRAEMKVQPKFKKWYFVISLSSLNRLFVQWHSDIACKAFYAAVWLLIFDLLYAIR